MSTSNEQKNGSESPTAQPAKKIKIEAMELVEMVLNTETNIEFLVN